MKIAEDIKYFFHQEGIHSCTIQPEFVEVCILCKPGYVEVLRMTYILFQQEFVE